MNTNELCIDMNNLPNPLDKEELYELFKKLKQGDEVASNIIFLHNMKLVLKQVYNRFQSVNYDKDDLISIGNIGLLNAIKTFDISKEVSFSNYAIKCIDNEILKSIRSINKNNQEISLDKTVKYNRDGNELKIGDTIPDKTDIFEDYTSTELYSAINEIVNNLPERDKEIIKLYFGFYDNKVYKQKEIADMMSLSKSYITKIIQDNVKKIGKILNSNGFIELGKQKEMLKMQIRLAKKEVGETEKMGKRLKSIYEFFDNYTKDEIDEVIEKLSEEEKKLIESRYGKDLNNPVSGKLSKEETSTFYSSLVYKMKKLLSQSKKRSEFENNLVKDRSEKILNKEKVEETVLDEIKVEESREKVNNEINIQTDSNLDYVKVLDLLKIPTFNQMREKLSIKETVIISLKFGFINGKYYSTESIANFLNIEKAEIIEVTKKVLLLCKQNINDFIDNAIVNEEEQIIKSNKKIK